MKQQELNRYAALMREAQLRLETIRDLEAGRSRTLYVRTNTESACLQLRKTLELIAFSSMTSHRPAYVAARAAFARDWHATRILKQIDKLNPDFYPRPISGFDQRGKPLFLRGDFLTRRRFELLFEKCGSLLHASNPFGRQRDFEAFAQQISTHVTRIEKLLSQHIVRLARTGHLLWVTVPKDDSPLVVRHLVKATR